MADFPAYAAFLSSPRAVGVLMDERRTGARSVMTWRSGRCWDTAR